MPLLREISANYTDPTLSKGLAQGIVDVGSEDFGAKLQFEPFQGESYDWNLKVEQPGGTAAIDPYDTEDNIVGGGGASARISLQAKALIRHADTPVIDVHGHSNYFDLRQRDTSDAASALYQELLRKLFAGTGLGVNPQGIEGHLFRYAGMIEKDASARDWATNADLFPEKSGRYSGANRPRYADKKVVYGSDITDPTKYEPFDLDMLDVISTRMKGKGADVIVVSTEALYNEIKAQLRAMPGNTAVMVMDEDFGAVVDGKPKGKLVLNFDGIPVLLVDAAGSVKHHTQVVNGVNFERFGGAATMDTTTLTVTNTDGKFVGFTDAYIGCTLTAYDAAGAVLGSQRIVEWNSLTSVELAANIAGTIAAFDVSRPNLIYGVRFSRGEMKPDGFCAAYYSTPGNGAPQGTPEYEEAIGGFSALDQGLHPNGDFYRTRIRFYGNTAAKDPHSLVRISGIKIGQ